MTRLLIDSHLDLAWSAVFFNRDLTRSVDEIRQAEEGMTDERSRARNTVTLPELKRAGIRLCIATLLARAGPAQARQSSGYKRTDLDYATPSLAYAAAHAQLAYYRLLERQGHLRFIRTRGELDAHWDRMRSGAEDVPLGIVLSME